MCAIEAKYAQLYAQVSLSSPSKILIHWAMDLIHTSKNAHCYGLSGDAIGSWRLFVHDVLELKKSFFTQILLSGRKNSVHMGAKIEKSIFERIWGEWYTIRFAWSKRICRAGWNKCQKFQITKFKILDVICAFRGSVEQAETNVKSSK